jgi:hypothetical protein
MHAWEGLTMIDQTWATASDAQRDAVELTELIGGWVKRKHAAGRTPLEVATAFGVGAGSGAAVVVTATSARGAAAKAQRALLRMIEAHLAASVAALQAGDAMIMAAPHARNKTGGRLQ